jgi:CheY-like chemotaxis protein
MSKWMLLAEDNVNDAELTLRSMSANPCSQDVIVTRDGAEALNCLYRREGFEERDTGNPAVVLLDLKMPKVDGLEVLTNKNRSPVEKYSRNDVHRRGRKPTC